MMHERGESTDEVSKRQARSLCNTDNGATLAADDAAAVGHYPRGSVSRRLGGVYFYEHKSDRRRRRRHASQRLAAGRSLIGDSKYDVLAQPRVGERRNPKEDANEPVA